MHSFSTSERFAHLDGAARDRIERLTKPDHFAAGETLWTQGQPSEWLGMVSRGRLALRLPGPGGERSVAWLKPGDLYGVLEGFADLPSGARLVAEEETWARICPKAPLRQALRETRPMAVGLLFAYARAISELLRQLNDSIFVSLESAGPLDSSAEGASAGVRLSEEELAWLGVLGRERRLPAEVEVVREGADDRSLYLIREGEVEVRRGSLALARMRPGELFGVMAFVDGQPRSASVFTQEASARFVVVEPDALDAALRLHFNVAFRFLSTLCVVLGRTFSETARRATRS